jgi:electron transport complex protein RnfE
VILGRADAYASKHALGPAMYDGFIMGMGFALVLLVLGAVRELFGTGALFADMDLLFGPAAASWKIVLMADYQPFLLAVLPPGAFIFTGLLIALKNVIDDRLKRRRDALRPAEAPGSRRVRVTGTIS